MRVVRLMGRIVVYDVMCFDVNSPDSQWDRWITGKYFVYRMIGE